MVDEKQPQEPVRIILDLPAGRARTFSGLVEDGLHPGPRSALPRGVVERLQRD